MRRVQGVLLACAALFTSASGSAPSAHAMRARYDKPGEAQEFFARKRAPVGERAIPVERYLAARRHIEGMAHYSTRERRFLAWPTASATGEAASAQDLAEAGAGAEFAGPWTPLGPGNVGGRTRAFLIDPSNPNTMYAAGVAGGVWKTTNAGASWTPLDDMMPNLAVSSLAMDPDDNDTIFAGTGEGYFNIDAVRGAGIFKTTNSGTNWTQLASTNTPDFHYVNDIVVSPLSSARIYAATRSGVWRSTDGGTSFSKVQNGAPVNGCTDLAMRTDQSTDVVFAACGTFATATVYRNTDAGGSGTWQAVLSETDMGRTSLAIAPSNQDTLYALASSNVPGPGGDYLDGLHAVFRSTTGGAVGTWTDQVRNTDATLLNTLLLTNPPYAAGCFGPAQFFNQGWYDNVIAVDPLDEDRVWVGGIEIFRSDDGGQDWGLASHWWASPSNSRYSHADKHALVFHPNFNGVQNQTLFMATDGGIFETPVARGATTTVVCSTNTGSVNWTERNNNYGVTQFYYGVSYPDGNTYFGGTQDNGTIRGDDAAGAEAWQQLQGGDGGAVAVDPSNTNILYAEFTGLSIQKSMDGGNSFNPATNGISDSGFLFIAPFIMDPSDSQRLWAGGRFMWRTSNAAGNWTQASTALGAAGSVSAIAVAPSDADFLLAGQGDGDIHRTSNGLSAGPGTSWAAVRPRAGYVSSLTFDPTNANVAYATYSTFGGVHVWKSTNAGANWSALDGDGGPGDLPDLPCHSIVVDPADTARLYLGTDLGVFVSLDGGLNWAVENSGFANVITEALVINDGELFAFTHGRGAWRVTLDPVTPPDITIDDVNVIEGNTGSVNATFTVSLSHSTGQTVTVQYASADGTAQAPADYTSSSGTLSFGPGQTSRTVAVPVIGDIVEEGNEAFVVDLSNATNASILDGQGLATIIDDDTPGTIVLSAASYTVSESGGSLTVTVLRLGGNSGGVTVDYATSNGTALAGSDYTAASGTLSFGVGVTSLTFAVPISGDTLDESDETFTVALSNPTGGAGLGTPSSATVTITDDDTAGSLAFSLASYAVSEAGSKATISVTRSGGAASGVTVQYTTSDGSASAGLDYTATSGTLTFGAKVSKLSFSVPIANDTLIETNETVLLELFSPGGGAFLGAQNTAVLTITENDLGGAFRFSKATYSVGEAAATVKVTVTRSGGTAPGVTVDFTTADGTAQAPGDYTNSSGTLSFASGQTSQTVTIPIVTDALDEVNETVNLTLSNPTGGATLGVPSASTLTITDNDTGGTLQFSLSAVSVDEGAGTALVAVSRTGGSADAVTVTCTPTDGSATSGQDHNGSVQILSFGAGVMSQNCTIPILEDGLAEGSETLSLTLSNATGGAGLGARQTAVLTITDNEPVTTLHFAGLLFAVSEGGKATATVKRSGPAASPVTVDYATSDGTGQAGSDYTTSMGTLSFAANATSLTFTVQTTADTVDESDEDVNLTLSNPTGGAVLGTQSAAKLAITDNDAGGALQFSAVNYNKAESSPTATITVTRTGGTASAVTVDYATSDGTAQAPGDYTASSGTLSFASGQKSKTFSVGLLEDALDEPNETVNLALSNPTGGATLGSPANATLTITDNDGGGVLQFSLTTVSVDESAGTASVVVSRTGGSAEVTVTCTSADGTATSGADYTGIADVLTFGAGVMSQNCTVPILPDALEEGPETVNLTLSNPTGGASLGTKQSAVLTITDDDETAATLYFVGSLFTVSEGGKATVTVKRSGDTTSAVSVNYATSDGTAGSSDYTTSAGTLSFGANVTSLTFTVQTTGDTLDESDEDVNLTLSSPGGGAQLGTQSTAKLLIIDNDAGGAFRVAKATYSVSEKSSSLKVTVSRTGGKASGVTVDFATSDGTAQAPGDYTTTAGTLTFAANQASQSVTIPIVPDTLDESNETLGFTLANPTGGATLGSPNASTVTITDNDTAGSVKLSAASYSLSESGGTLTIAVTRSGGTSGDVTVDYTTSDGTAQAGADYQTASGTLTFGVGETSKTFPVNINPDGLAEANETVLVTLSNVGGGGTLGSPSTATLYIVDDE